MSSIRPLTPLERRLLAAVERIGTECAERETMLLAEVAALRTELDAYARRVSALSEVLAALMGPGDGSASSLPLS